MGIFQKKSRFCSFPSSKFLFAPSREFSNKKGALSEGNVRILGTWARNFVGHFKSEAGTQRKPKLVGKQKQTLIKSGAVLETIGIFVLANQVNRRLMLDTEGSILVKIHFKFSDLMNLGRNDFSKIFETLME